MNKYDSEKFVSALTEKVNSNGLPRCPYCGADKFTTTKEYGSLLINDDLDGLNIGPSIPMGLLVCMNCGHIELFALGALGLLNNADESAVDGE